MTKMMFEVRMGDDARDAVARIDDVADDDAHKGLGDREPGRRSSGAGTECTSHDLVSQVSTR